MNNTNTMNELVPDTIEASATSASSDFDFLLGKWAIYNRKLNSRLNNCDTWTEFESTDEVQHLLGGMGNLGQFKATLNDHLFEGITMRLFNPVTRLWKIYWADNNRGILDKPVTGSFENKTGVFYAEDIFEHKVIHIKFHWDATDEDRPVWSQAFSNDGGQTWEWNWFMYFSRI